MAALWVKELLQSLYKVKKTVEMVQNWERDRYHGKEAQKVKVYKTLKRKSKRKLKMKLTASHIHKQMVKEVEKLNPNLKEVISLRIQKLPSRLSELQFLQNAILKPSPCTRMFLPWYVAYSGFTSAIHS
jgi:transcription termination factor NusB